MSTLVSMWCSNNMENGRNTVGKFTSGNPGRPKGPRNRKTLAIESQLKGQAEARELLFEYGWQPIKAEEIEWMASERAKTPELTSCTASGLFMCHYTYETNNAYLEVVTKGEPEPTVSVVEGRCN